MLVDVEVSTPLGPVGVSLAVDTGDEVVHTERVELPTGAVLSRWWTGSRLEVRALLVRYDEAWNARAHLTVSGCWGVAWTVLSERSTSPVTVRATTPPGHDAGPNNGEWLEAVELGTPAWTVTVGGPDDDLLSQRVGSGLPASWEGSVGWPWIVPTAADTPFGADSDARGVTWLLPPLEPREIATTHVAVAWAPEADEHGVASWFAVDTCSGDLLDYAGLVPARPHRRGWDHVPRA